MYVFCRSKAVFDKVDRSKLWKELRKKRVKEELIRRAEIIYEETEVMGNYG